LIIDPVTLLENATIGDAMKLMRGFSLIGGLPFMINLERRVGMRVL
jgi:hypothetical protein